MVDQAPGYPYLRFPISRYVVDGGWLLHVVTWVRPGTYADICNAYVTFLKRRYDPGLTTIVFDGYDGPPSTKAMEQRRRSSWKTSANVVVNSEDFVTTPRDNFLGNNCNKSRLINLLKTYLQRAGYCVGQAEGDADRAIARTAFKKSDEGHVVSVVATDTDILTLLVNLSSNTTKASMIIPGTEGKENRVHNIAALKQSLEHAQDVSLFGHAMSGCDTTGAFFKKGKLIALNLIRNDKGLSERMKVFYNPNASKKEIAQAGEEFILALYNGSKFKTLNEFRLSQYRKLVGKQKLDQKFDFRTLAPTSGTAEQKSYRVYLQVQNGSRNVSTQKYL